MKKEVRKVDCVFIGLKRKPIFKKMKVENNNTIKLNYKGTGYAFFAPEAFDNRVLVYLITSPRPISDDGSINPCSPQEIRRMLDTNMIAAFVAAATSFRKPVATFYLPELKWREALYWLKRAVKPRSPK